MVTITHLFEKFNLKIELDNQIRNHEIGTSNLELIDIYHCEDIFNISINGNTSKKY